MGAGGRPRGFDPDTALDAAVDTFWRHGYEGAGLAELTEAMSISRPALYRAFGDKEQLFQAALTRYVDRNMRYVADALSRATAREVAEAFLTGNAMAVTTPGQPQGCLSVQAMVTNEADVFALLAENRRTIQARLRDRFAQAITDGDLAAGQDPDHLARFLITLATGFAIRAADGETREGLLAVAHCALATFSTPSATLPSARETDAARPFERHEP